MEKLFARFCNTCACAGVLIGAPLIIVSGVFFTMDQFNKYVEVSNCRDFARLDQVARKCE